MLSYLISLFKTLKILIWGISFYMVLLNIMYLRYLLQGRKFGRSLEEYAGKFFSTKRGIVLAESIIALSIILSPPVFSHFENTNIGSFLEKDTYSERYYVFVRNDSAKAKSYRVKADIIRSSYSSSSYVDVNGYLLKKLYWPNGGYLIFIDEDDLYSNASNAEISPLEEAYCEDIEGNGYYVTLTLEKANL